MFDRRHRAVILGIILVACCGFLSRGGAGIVNPPTVSLSVAPTSITPSGSSTLTWSSTNASACSGYGGYSTGGAIGGSLSVNPITTSTYGLSCLGPDGVASTVATLTVSQTNVVNANGNCMGSHAGTDVDPYPFGCIVTAINSLPSGGGTVIVGDGTWAATAENDITRGNWNLVGNSLSAKISFIGSTGTNLVWINPSAAAIGNIRLSNLTLDGTQYTDAFLNAIRLTGLSNAVVSNNTIICAQNSGLSVMLLEGGDSVELIGNSIQPNPMTNAGLGPQFNPLSGTTNSGMVAQGNTFNSAGLLVIGLNTALFAGNSFNNTATGTSLGIEVATTLGTPGTVGSNGVTVDANTVDATTGSANLALISQIPQDPGITTDVYNIIFSNNTIKGTNVTVSLQANTQSCINTCNPLPNTFNARIIGNRLTSIFSTSTISIQGGTNGSVVNPLVQGNTLISASGFTSQILQDAHTFSPTIVGNVFSP